MNKFVIEAIVIVYLFILGVKGVGVGVGEVKDKVT